tara:strand:- start:310 stop:459 length:150 start_codon:yes stop_codon:yes gene_type:complete
MQDPDPGRQQLEAGQQEDARIRKEMMDYFMIILPLKLALVIYIAYVLFH